MSDECLMTLEFGFPFYIVYQAVIRKFTLAGKAFTLKVCLADGITCFCIIRSDARARTKQLVTEVGNRKKLNRNPTAFFLLTSYLFPLTGLLQQIVIEFDYSVSKC